MWSIFKGALVTLSRTKELYVWALIFPLVLSTMFMLMFANLDDAASFEPVRTAVVDDAEYAQSPAFSTVLDKLAEPSDDQIIDASYYRTSDEAREALLVGNVSGIISVDEQGTPSLSVGASAGMGIVGTEQINRTILKTVVDTYVRNAALLGDIAADNPRALADPATIESALAASSVTEQVSLTRNEPVQSVRFYYALLGMATLFTAQVGLMAICAAQPNLSALGARRALGSISRTKTLLATLLASWLLSFACLVVAFLYIRFVVNIDFAGREPACIAALAVSALLATALGTMLGSLPKLNMMTKVGILTVITCFTSLFAGLYGEPCMQLADEVARTYPLLAAINPAKVITDSFYSLYYYDSLVPFAEKVGILIAITTVFFAVSALFMRKQRYASL